MPDVRMLALRGMRGADRGRGMQRVRRAGRGLRLHTEGRVENH